MAARISMGLCLALVALAFAGCSSRSEGPAALVSKLSPAEVVKAAPLKAADAKTVYFEATVEIGGVPGYKTDGLTTKMSGASDFEKRQTRMETDVMGMEVSAIQDGTVIYMQIPLVKGWVKMDFADMVGEDAAAQLLGGANSNNPAATLDTLRGAAESVEVLGADRVRGVDTVHYRATVDPKKALAELQATSEGEWAELFDTVMQTMPDTYPVDVWIDEDNLPRRISFTLELSGAAPELDGVTTTMTMEFFDYGKPVQIELPDPSEVTDWSDLMAGITA